MTHKAGILFQTDFGIGGGASMYGMCKIVDPSLYSGELSHSIPTFDVAAASRRLAGVMPFWPEGTVFVSVVDPGVGTARRACVAKTANGYYVATPDNGTLTDVIRRYGVTEVREIDERINRYPDTPKVSIFHGRDLFAYCAARLASGVITYEQVGPAYAASPVQPEENTPLSPDGISAVLNRAALVSAGAAAVRPSSVVVLNDFNHDGRLAMVRGLCRRVCFNMDVFDWPVNPVGSLPQTEISEAAALVSGVMPCWPEGTVFVMAQGLAVADGNAPVVSVRTLGGQWLVAPGHEKGRLLCERLSAANGVIVDEMADVGLLFRLALRAAELAVTV